MISAVIITKNEEGNLPLCLKGLSWCDEIVVIDDNSHDKTVNIAKKMGAKVFIRSMNQDFAAQRNFGLRKAQYGWVFFVDADERVTQKLADEIKVKLQDTSADAFLVKREDIFMGKYMQGGEWGGQWLLRLARKNSGQWTRAVHETWEVGGKIDKLTAPLLHSPHPTLFSLLAKINFYFQLHAKSNAKGGKKANILKIIFIPIFKFIINFLVKRGYQDGVYGFVYAVLLSFHSFLSWSELWLLQKAKR